MRRDSLKAPRVYTIPPVQVDCLQSAFYSHRTIFFESGLLFEGIRPLLSSFSGQRPISAFLGYSELSPRTGVRSPIISNTKAYDWPLAAGECRYRRNYLCAGAPASFRSSDAQHEKPDRSPPRRGLKFVVGKL
jgi:hypothetical protein